MACVGTTNAAGANVGLLLKSGPNGWYSFKVNAAGLGSITAGPGTNIITYNMNGNVGIGTTPQDGANPYKLVVEGKIGAREINVKATGAWPDYVFEEGYKLPDLTTLSQYLSINKHLPQLPNAANVASNGIDVGIMQMLLLKKIEELYLIVIKQQKEIEKLQNK
ncbi:MAG: hypothetical protein IPP29_20255 [Bacteroidetes bacterium]|nr:hypothetical protein [Bacteroidota bacterium]